MTAAPTGRGRSRLRWASASVPVLLVVLVLVGAGLVLVGLRGSSAAPPRPAQLAVGPTSSPRLDEFTRTGQPLLVDVDAAPPVQLVIPRLRVTARIVPLATAADGTLNTPPRWSDAGWWINGPEPGEAGAAVVAGHVDSTRRPAVFYRLAELRPGDRITVVRRDHTSVTFTVDRRGQYPKNRFPTSAVYRPTRTASLRLITCGGSFNRRSGHYQDNVVVYASRMT